jgi:dipeptidase D
MSDATSGLKPEGVWKYFVEVSEIPRCSGNEKRVSDYVVETATKLGLDAKQDRQLNVVVTKPAAIGRESAPSVCLQGHLDMVCEKNKGVEHDFESDPIELVREGNVLTANGTTLGADNGIAVATHLALMEDDSLAHGPLEFLFTVDEETGLTGAGQLKPGFVESRILLNLDSEDEGVLFVGCAGGRDTVGRWKLEMTRAPSGALPMLLRVEGLVGGHSGLEIDKQRGNSIKILARALDALANLGVRLGRMEGGNKRNAIPREAEALVFVPEAVARKAKSLVRNTEASIREELAAVDPDVTVTLERAGEAGGRKALRKDDQALVIRTLRGLPHGVIKMSEDIPGLVETSTNVAVIRSGNGELVLETSQRSSVKSEIEEIAGSVSAIMELGGASVEAAGGYPGWKPNMESRVLEIARSTYRELFGKAPEVTAVHAGLECGIIGERYPGMDMVSFGPTLRGVHSPDEKILIDTVERFWDYLCGILQRIG